MFAPMLPVLAVLLAPVARAQDAMPFVCGRVDAMATDLDPAWDWRDAAVLWYEPGSVDTRVELGTLDATAGFAASPTAWGDLFSGDFGLQSDLGLGYDRATEGPLFVAVRPAPAHDLSVTCDRGALTVRLPDTRGTRFGATFAVSDDGATWWADADHDGLTVKDRLDWEVALTAAHLARAADEPAGDPGDPPVSPDWNDHLAGVSGSRAFTAGAVGSPVRLGWEDGRSITPEEVPEAFGAAFDLLDGGDSLGSPSWPGTTGRAYPLTARYQDLSDCAGWPEVEVSPGILAVDPRFGRFALSAGAPEVVPAARAHFHSQRSTTSPIRRPRPSRGRPTATRTWRWTPRAICCGPTATSGTSPPPTHRHSSTSVA